MYTVNMGGKVRTRVKGKPVKEGDTNRGEGTRTERGVTRISSQREVRKEISGLTGLRARKSQRH